jgi:hypothetical protein
MSRHVYNDMIALCFYKVTVNDEFKAEMHKLICLAGLFSSFPIYTTLP